MRRRYGIRKPDGELAAGINEPTPGRAVGAFTRSQEGAPPWQHCWHEGYRIAVLPSVGPGKHVTLSRDNAQAVSEQHEVSAVDLPFEYMLGALRLRDGFSLQDFTARTGLPAQAVEAQIYEASRNGWLQRSGDRVQPTARGFDFLSDVQALFLP